VTALHLLAAILTAAAAVAVTGAIVFNVMLFFRRL
jgi:hypothetical protein